MSVTVLLEAPVKTEAIPTMKSYLAELLPETRDYAGCQGIHAYFTSQNDGTMILIEHWDSRPQHEQYLAWRTETGVMGKLGGMLAGPPRLRYFDRVEA